MSLRHGLNGIYFTHPYLMLYRIRAKLMFMLSSRLLNYALFIGLVCTSVFSTLLAQTNIVQVNAPPAPEAATFGRFGDIPVGEFTGSAQVNVPVYTLSHRGLSIPIGLSYQSTGIRVSEEAGWVGLGWALNTGGMITRTIRGYDDFGNRDLSLWCGVNVNNAYTGFWQLANSGQLPTGFAQDGEYSDDYYSQLAHPDVQPNSSEQAFYLANGPVSEEYFCLNPFDTKDLQSDLYTYNLLGYSGKFIIDNNGEVKFLEAADIDMELIYNSTDDVRWIATLPSGIKVYLGTNRLNRQLTYKVSRTFAVTDGTVDYSQFDQCYGTNEDIEPDQYISTWFIEKIVLPTQEVVNYNYAFDQQYSRIHPVPSLSETDKSKVESQIIWQLNGAIQAGNTSPNNVHSGAMTYVGYDNIILQSISIPAKQEDVLFYTSDTATPTERLDLSGARKLEKIEIIRSGQVYKSFDLTYDYFTADPNQNGWHQGSNPYLILDSTDDTYYVNFDISPNVPTFYFEDDLVGKRLRLLSIVEKGYDGAALPPYSFQYHEFPAIKTSYAIDYWGFYNGRDQSTTFFPQVEGAVVPGTLANSDPVLAMGRGGADRSSTDSNKAGLLRQITYPTGGKTNFTYEQNRYLTDAYEVSRVPMSFSYARASSDLTDCTGGTIPSPTAWTYIDNENPNVPLFFNINFAWQAVDFESGNPLLCQNAQCFYPLLDDDDLQAAAVQFRLVVEDDVDGDIYYIDWDQNATTADFNVSEGNYDVVSYTNDQIVIGPFPEGRSYRIRLEPYSTQGISSSIPWNVLQIDFLIEWPEFSPITERTGGGVRIRELSSVTESGSVGSIKTYDYTAPDGTTSGRVYSDPFNYHYETTIFNATGTGFLAPIWSLGGINSTDYSNTYLVRSSNSMHSLSNSYFGRFVGYNFVSISEGGEQNNGRCDKTFYTYGNQGFTLNPLLSHYDVPSFAMQREGSILHEDYYNSSGALVKTVNYTYNSNWGGAGSAREASDSRFGLEFGYQAFYPASLPNTGELNASCSYTGSSLLLFIYAEAPQWHYLDSIITKEYGQDGSFTTATTAYDYEEQHFNLTEEKITGTGLEWTTKFKYAEELGSCILADHMTGIPLEVEAPNGVTYLTEYDCTYKVPSTFTETYQDGSQITRSQVTSFDANAYPLSINRFGFSTPETYTWKPSPAPQGLLESKSYLDWEETYIYNNFRQIERTIGIDEQPIEYDYDSHGRLYRIKARPGSAASGYNVLTTLTYDLGGPNIITNETVYEGAPTQTTLSYFDGLGRPTKTVLNGVTKEETLYDGIGRVSASTYLPGSFTRFDYDGSPLNRLTRETYPDGNSVQFNYSAENNEWVTTRINERGFPTKSYTDILGRDSKMEDAINNITDKAYDSFGRLITIVSPAGAFSYGYDDRNRLITKSVPDAGTMTYCYDNATDLLCSSIDAEGNRLSTTYDAYQRPTFVYLETEASTNCNCNTSGDVMVANQYDGAGLTAVDGTAPIYTGKLSYTEVSMIGAAGNVKTQFILDDFGRIEQQYEEATIDGSTINTRQTHSLNGADWLLNTEHTISGIANGAAYDHSFNYDNFGRVIMENAAGVQTDMLYNDQDQMVFKLYDGGTARQDYEYNERGWLTNINILRPEVFTPEDLGGIVVTNPCQPATGEDETYVVHQEVTAEEFFDLLCSGLEVDVPGVDLCPPEDPEHCLTDYYNSVYPELILNPSLFFSDSETNFNFFQSAKEQCDKGNSRLCIPYGFTITDIKDYAGNTIPLGYDYDIINTYDTEVSCLEEINIIAEANSLRNDLINYLDSNGYDYDEVNINVIWDNYNAPASPLGVTRAFRLEFEVLGSSNFRLGEITTEYALYCYDVGKGTIIDKYTLSVVQDADITVTSFNNCGPIGIFPPAAGSGDVHTEFETAIQNGNPAALTFPAKLYEVITSDQHKLWMLEDELQGIGSTYHIHDIIHLTSAQQGFKVTKVDGQVLSTDLNGLFAQRSSDIYLSDVEPTGGQVAQTPGQQSGNCPPTPLGCDAATEQAQQESLDDICKKTKDLFDSGDLSYPINVSVVQLCSGEITYVLEELDDFISGNHVILSTFPIDEDGIDVEVAIEEAFFAMQFEHQENGNIDQVKWKVSNRATSIYDYSYDEIDRVKGSSYAEEYFLDETITTPQGLDYTTRTLVTDPNNRYNTIFSYDGAGNIQTIWRNGVGYACGPEGQIDKMTLTYQGNRLSTVLDEAPSNLREYGFKPHPSSNHGSFEFQYDLNGNMTYDPHKLLNIDYNHLNLPERIRKGGTDILTTVYDATGRKWKKTSTTEELDEFNQSTGSTYTETRVYVNGVEFSGEGTAASKIASINASADGRVAYNYDASTGAPAGSRVEYYHTDHLGNVRLAFSDLDGDGAITVQDIYDPTNEITQERHYYPFGLTHTGAWFATVSPENAYRYNGKELDEAVGLYDYGARYYDPAVARFTSIDALADTFPSWSPYSYGFNNPLKFTDPTGMAPDNVIITGPEAARATQELDKSSSLTITRNAQTGELSASGKARGRADRKLLAAINDQSITVELQTTTNGTYNSADGTKNIPLMPGGYEGSTVDPNTGHVDALQLINMNSATNIATAIGEQTGETVRHEINESYIGANQDPGGNYNSGYRNAHNAAARLDRVSSNLEFNQDKSRRMMQARQIGATKWVDIVKY